MKILIADDQLPPAHLLQTQVRAWGYEALVVPDGFAALQALRAPNAPRLALLDWQMPGLNGIEVCRRLRAENDREYTYLVLVTGFSGRQVMLDGLEAGADDFLAKPIDSVELRARLGTGRRILTMQEQLCVLATRDSLTELYNRAAILAMLQRELARSQREGRPVSVLLADIDHFKHINDSYGHLVGDAVLREVAGRLQDTLRPYDAVGRYGGEEFLVVLPGCDGSTASGLAERLRQHVADRPVQTQQGNVAVTLSIGIAAWEGVGDAAPVELLRAADGAMYSAKNAGRNRTMLGMSFASEFERGLS